MTVSTTTRKNSYTGNGSSTVFAYSFRIFSDSDIKVYVDGTLKSLSTHYTISGAGSASGGNVTFTSGNTPPDTKSVVIIRELPRTQPTDYVANSALSATSLEDTADKNLMLIQEIDAKAEDGFRFADTVVDAGTITIDKNAADRANKLLSFDASGNLIATQEIGVSRGNWAASTAYAQRDIIKDTNNNNIYLCIVAHTSSGSVPISTNTDAAKWVLLVDSASATTSQTAAASSATAAASSASSASSSASTASTQATNSANSATASAASATSAEASTGASAFKFVFDNSTSMADPGTGEIRFNHATISSVTQIAFDAVSSDTGNPDVSDFIASWDDGTNSAHEGYITIRKSGTPATYAVFSLTGSVTDSTGYLTAVVTHVDSNGSWSNADTMYISFTRSGQLGSTGAIGPSAGLDMVYESTTTDADQGVGKTFFNHGTLSSASIMYMDDVDSNSASINSYVDSWDDSTTTALRGTVTITKQADAAVFAIYNVTGAVTSASTYSKIPVSYVTGAGSFTDADACTVQFVRTGNTGSAGSSTPADNVFRIQDNGDNTKQIAFEASSIGSGTTRTVTMPNSDVTLGTPLDGTVATDKIANNAVDETKLKDALIGDFTDATVTASDTFMHGDATDSGNTKRDTVQGILDLVTSAPARNFIIDGDFTQFPEGNITAIANSAYGAALWENFDVGGELVHDVDQLADVPTVGQSKHASTYSMSIDVTTAESAVAAGDFQVIEYKVTGSDFAHLHQQQVTLSFWHKHTKTGTFCGYFMNSAEDRSYVYEYTQSVADTWEQHTETVTLDSSGTWLLTNTTIGLRVGFCMYGGSNFQGTADSWEGAKDYCTSSQVAGADSASNFCKFSQVGLYLGASAPDSFVGEPLATVKDQVDYYIQRYNYDQNAYEVVTHGYHRTTSYTSCTFYLRKEMRDSPTISFSAANTFTTIYDTTNATLGSAITGDEVGVNSIKITATHGSAIFTLGRGAYIARDNVDTTFMMADARH